MRSSTDRDADNDTSPQDVEHEYLAVGERHEAELPVAGDGDGLRGTADAENARRFPLVPITRFPDTRWNYYFRGLRIRWLNAKVRNQISATRMTLLQADEQERKTHSALCVAVLQQLQFSAYRHNREQT